MDGFGLGDWLQRCRNRLQSRQDAAEPHLPSFMHRPCRCRKLADDRGYASRRSVWPYPLDPTANSQIACHGLVDYYP